MISRRGLITGLVSFVAAPAIVRITSLMPVSAKAIDANKLVIMNNGMWVDFGRPYSLGGVQIAPDIFCPEDVMYLVNKDFIPKNALEELLDIKA